MIEVKKPILAALTSGMFAITLATAVQAQEVTFKHVMNIGTEGTGPGQFKYVEDFAFSADGHLLATDAAHAWVQVFDKTTGAYIERFAGKGDDDHQLEKPEGISVDPDGNIFVADYTTGYVKKYDRKYNWLLTFSDYGSEPGENIKSEFTDIYKGKYYMPEAGNHRVSVWDLEGNFLFLFGGKGTAPGKMNNPEAAKFTQDVNDNIESVSKAAGETGAASGQVLNAAQGVSRQAEGLRGEVEKFLREIRAA